MYEDMMERAAIMQYEGGLDRRAALLAAFETCYPADYRECMEIADDDADGMNALYARLPPCMHDLPPDNALFAAICKTYSSLDAM